MSKHGSVSTLSAAFVFLAAVAAPRIGQAILITNFFDTDPLWTGVNNTSGGNSYGYSAGTANAGGPAGEIGGTFARSAVENYYADTHDFFGEHFTLGNALEASGNFIATNVTAMNNPVQIGHRSAGTSDGSFVGLELDEWSATQVRAFATIDLADGTRLASAPQYIEANAVGWFSYSYNPTGGANSQGQLSLAITNSASSYSLTLDLTSGNRAVGATLDAFGMGSFPINSVPTDHGDAFLDNVIFTAIPEPGTVALAGLVAMMVLSRRRRASSMARANPGISE